MNFAIIYFIVKINFFCKNSRITMVADTKVQKALACKFETIHRVHSQQKNCTAVYVILSTQGWV